MPIIRGNHSYDSHFTQIPNAWLRDKRLSYKAKGLLAELSSHTVGWEVSIIRIANQGVDGRDAIGSAIQELERCGYLRREQTRDDLGRLAGNTWITQDPTDTPLADNPSTDNPATDNPLPKKNIAKNKDLEEVNAQFELFWRQYPRRVGRGNALKAFVGLSKEERELSIAGAISMAEDRNLPSLQFVPYPATWINREGWLDESYPERETTKEEKLLRAQEESAKRSQIAREENDRVLEEIEAAKQEAALNPPKLCKHNTVAVICKVCARINKN
jgi:hypothetical protein